LFGRRREQKITLVAASVRRAVKCRPAPAFPTLDVVPGGERVGAEFSPGSQQVVELDPLIAAYARDRRLSRDIARREVVDNPRAKALLVIEDVMRNAQPIGDSPRIMDVLAGAAGSGPADRLTVIIELQRDAGHLVAGLDQKRRRHRAVDAARHGDDDAGCGAVCLGSKYVHGRQYRVLRGVLKSSCQHAMRLCDWLRHVL
jgi:hypothetical protein